MGRTRHDESIGREGDLIGRGEAGLNYHGGKFFMS